MALVRQASTPALRRCSAVCAPLGTAGAKARNFCTATLPNLGAPASAFCSKMGRPWSEVFPVPRFQVPSLVQVLMTSAAGCKCRRSESLLQGRLSL